MNAESSPTPRSVETVEDLVQYIELTGLRTFEIAGKRSEKSETSTGAESAGDTVSPGEAASQDDAAMQADISLEIMESHDVSHIVTRFRATIEARDADYVADFGLRYDFAEPLALEQDAIEGLLNRVAVMSAWPFIREAVATTAARMELEVPVLGLLKQGEFRVSRVERPE